LANLVFFHAICVQNWTINPTEKMRKVRINNVFRRYHPLPVKHHANVKNYRIPFPVTQIPLWLSGSSVNQNTNFFFSSVSIGW